MQCILLCNCQDNDPANYYCLVLRKIKTLSHLNVNHLTAKMGTQNQTRRSIDVTPLISSAPSSSKVRTVPLDIQQTINNLSRRSNSCVESKYKCSITSERLSQLRKIVENATRDHRVYTIKGRFYKGTYLTHILKCTEQHNF